ncbi:T9SS type A sorting domain-containing protein [Xanthomarina sp. F1114]|uniref:T9SS type A sorting domain-containing protein n=1 Tax=Xanthomarina sp. F1114 TaxID=2996019 RepID=UPI00225E5DD8|nr:T9SS type A sorting domain-containing protein [Xanthomarina sp. F1114]MCX7548058.1 T9SS type A sorting domain-containing protein [Xanthomarina sp. F1114]
MNPKQSISQTTAIADSNFEQVLVDLNIDTNGVNGNILDSDASAVYYLNLSENYIQDLTGIEAFVDLKTLDCSANNLTELDLSQNKKLLELNANDNQISNIDLSLNGKLKVALINSNYLNEIDVSNNFDLEELGVSLNSLTELVVTNNLSLKHLSCYSNNLNNLDLSNNSQLISLHVGDNNFSALDVSQNEMLHTFTCNENSLSELSIENNVQLSYLDCRNNNISNIDINDNTGLQRLFVSNNNLNEVDLSNAPNLKMFYAINNNLTTLDISSNSILRWVKCDQNNLSSVDFRNGNNINISEFRMTQNSGLSCIFVDDADASFLASWIVDDTSAFVEYEYECEALSIKDNSLTDINMYPNPALGSVNFEVNTESAKLELYAISGQLVHAQTLNYGVNKIALTNFSSGLYMAKISSNQTLETKKLLIK